MKERTGYYWDVLAWRQSRQVRAMSPEARAIYREALDEIWINGAIPNDVNLIANLTGWPLETVTRCWPTIYACLVPTKKNPDLFTSERLEKERKKRREYVRSKREAARRGGLRSAQTRERSAASFSQPLDRADVNTQARAQACAQAPVEHQLSTSEACASPLVNQNEPKYKLLVSSTSIKEGKERGEHPDLRTRLGEFQHVQLLPEDVADLRSRLGEHFDVYLQRLDLYGETCPAKFRKYKNHKAVLLSWYSRDHPPEGVKPNGQAYESPTQARVRRSNDALDRGVERVLTHVGRKFPGGVN